MPLSDQEIKDLLEKAEAYSAKNDLASRKEALKCYDELIENAPAHPHYFAQRAVIKHTILGHISFAPFDLESVINDIGRAIELDPDRGEYYKARGAYLWYGLKDISDKNYLERIKADYNACTNKDPNNSDAWLALIGTNIFLHNWDDAIAFYGSCRPFIKTKEDQLIRAWLGCLAFALADDPIKEQDKSPLYDQTIILSTQEDIFSKISIFLKENHAKEDDSKKWQKAVEIHLQFIEHFNDYNSKGNLLYYLEHYEDALKAYEKSLEIDPANFVVWGNKGNTLKKLKRYGEALRAFEKGIDLKPDDVKAWISKNDVLAALGRYEEAFKALDKAIELGRDDDEKFGVASRFADKLIELGRYEEAFKTLDKAIELRPDDEKYAVALGFANKLIELGRYEEAFKALDKAIELRRDDEKYAVALGFANKLAALGRYEEAFKALDKAIGLRPDNKKCGTALAFAEELIDLGSYKEAFRALDKVIALSPDDEKCGWALGFAEYLAKECRYEEAIIAYEKVMVLKPGYIAAWYRSACMHSLTGDKEQSLELLSMAIQFDAKYKKDAQKDEAFKDLWEDEEFKRIIS